MGVIAVALSEEIQGDLALVGGKIMPLGSRRSANAFAPYYGIRRILP
jgi:hypothetical protein